MNFTNLKTQVDSYYDEKMVDWYNEPDQALNAKGIKKYIANYMKNGKCENVIVHIKNFEQAEEVAVNIDGNDFNFKKEATTLLNQKIADDTFFNAYFTEIKSKEGIAHIKAYVDDTTEFTIENWAIIKDKNNNLAIRKYS